MENQNTNEMMKESQKKFLLKLLFVVIFLQLAAAVGFLIYNFVLYSAPSWNTVVFGSVLIVLVLMNFTVVRAMLNSKKK
jgi:membrane protein YdbS with pleckstrin-like domain